MKVLITGFEPFGSYSENLSQLAATKLKKLGNWDVYGMVFPVRIFPRKENKNTNSVNVGGASFPVVVSTETIENYGELIVAKALEIKADAIISLGIASDVHGLRIETRAINWVENFKYGLVCEQQKVIASNFLPKEELKVNREKWNLTKLWHLSSLSDKFNEADFDCNLNFSADAGTFCCNALMFRTLAALQKNKCEIPYLFLHTPCSPGAVKNISDWDLTKDLMSLEKLAKVLEIILDNSVIEEKAIDVIRRMNPGQYIPTGEELANLIKRQN